jgi:hypothetical protein
MYSCYFTCCIGKRNRKTKIRNEVFKEVTVKNLAERDQMMHKIFSTRIWKTE